MVDDGFAKNRRLSVGSSLELVFPGEKASQVALISFV
jgi:hypothetical protein